MELEGSCASLWVAAIPKMAAPAYPVSQTANCFPDPAMKLISFAALSSLLLVSALSSQDGAEIAVRYVDAYPKQDRFDRPIFLAHTPADPGHVYVMQQTGTIWRIPEDAESSDRELFMSLDDTVFGPHNGGHNEEGLLGFAFDPAYAKNGFVYVYYSQKTGEKEVQWPGQDGKARKRMVPERQSVVARYATQAIDDHREVEEGTELAILTVPQRWGNHNGGTIEFGPDGHLYIALGDSGAANDMGGNGQNLGTILATISRIDVRAATEDKPYAIPEGNPFVSVPGARPEIYAYGLRNPWRMSFDRKTGDLWCADVGQNLWEEIDRIVAGGNYGWPVREGLHPFTLYKKPTEADAKANKASFIEPVADYSHKDGISITGGYVYRGKMIPALEGRFIYADYATKRMWAALEDRKAGKHHVANLPAAPMMVASFGELPNGELLLCCFNGKLGRLYRILPAN